MVMKKKKSFHISSLALCFAIKSQLQKIGSKVRSFHVKFREPLICNIGNFKILLSTYPLSLLMEIFHNSSKLISFWRLFMKDDFAARFLVLGLQQWRKIYAPENWGLALQSSMHDALLLPFPYYQFIIMTSSIPDLLPHSSMLNLLLTFDNTAKPLALPTALITIMIIYHHLIPTSEKFCANL